MARKITRKGGVESIEGRATGLPEASRRTIAADQETDAGPGGLGVIYDRVALATGQRCSPADQTRLDQP